MTIGIDSNTSNSDRLKIEFLNLVFIVGIQAVFVFLLINIFFKHNSHGYFMASLWIVGLITIPILNSRKFTLFTAIFFCSFLLIIAVFASISFGPRLNLSVLFLVMVLLSHYLLEKRLTIIFLILVFSAYTFTKIYVIEVGQLLDYQAWDYAEYFYVFSIMVISSFLQQKYLQVTEDYKKQILQNNEILAQKNEELERFSFMVAHDLKTPLRNISIYLSLYAKGDLAKEQKNEYINLAKENCVDLHDSINDILEYSKVDYSESKFTEVDLNSILLQIKKNYHIQLKQNLVNITSTPLPIIQGDKLLVKILFQNIIENGLKYNESKNPTVQIESFQSGNHFQVSIKDNGIGIDELFLVDVFKVFHRLHSSKEYKGTGLGLAISKRIMDKLGGGIRIESQVGVGSKVILEFPK